MAIVALLRDISFASYFGTSSEADALTIAYFIPDMLGNNLIAAAIGITCIPVFSKLFVDNEFGRFFRCINKVSKRFILISLIFTICLACLENIIITVFGKNFDPATIRLSLLLFNIILSSLLFFPQTAIFSSSMQVMNKFKIPALAPVLFNLIFLSGILCNVCFNIPIGQGTIITASFILLGTISMFMFVWISFNRSTKNFENINSANSKSEHSYKESINIKQIFAPFFIYSLILLSSQTVYYFERHVASKFASGSIAGLNYAFRLSQVPIWIFISAFSTVFLPWILKSKQSHQNNEFTNRIKNSILMVFLGSIPISLFLYFARVPIISVLFVHGTFNKSSLDVTQCILAGYSLAVIGQSLTYVCLRIFLALDRMILALVITIFSSTLNIISDYYLTGIIGIAGLGYGAAIGASVNAALMLIMVRRSDTVWKSA